MTVGTRLQLRRNTATNWATDNPVLLAGEMGVETDTSNVKVGDGTSAWNLLSYANQAAISSSLSATYAPVTPAVNTQSGTTYTLVLGDAGGEVDTSSASAVTVTVPPNSSAAFPVGTLIEVTQLGAGKATIAPGAGVTIKSAGSVYSVGGQYVTVGLRKTATDVWLLTGYLVT